MLEFLQAIRADGWEPPDFIKPGRHYRYPGRNKPRGNQDGFCYLYDDGRGGYYGDWSTDEKKFWFADSVEKLSQADRERYRLEAKDAQRKNEEERTKAQLEAAIEAKEFWDGADPGTDHGYLKHKGILAYGSRQRDGWLLVPIMDGENLVSIQKIDADGNKRFWTNGKIKGCYYLIGEPQKVIYMAEGYATAASVFEATETCCCVCFSAGNLEPVEDALRARFKDAKLIVAGDNDKNETGQRKARETGLEVLLPPEFGDWNDYALKHGLQVVKDLLEPKQSIGFSQFSMRRRLEELEQALIDEEFLIDELALMGQSTVFYAPPNSGKTLIILKLLVDAVREGRIKGEDVIYINADDDMRGLYTKQKLCAEVGIEMLAPGYFDFELGEFLPRLKQLADHDLAKGKVIVVDTLKAVSDLMDNSKQNNEFNPVIKNFISKGGTFLAMAHTNKNRVNGELLPGGTASVRDDFSCVYIIETLSDEREEKVVEFRNIKKRGTNVRKAQYTYASKAANYFELFGSLRKVSEMEAQDNARKAAIESQLKKNTNEIEAIESCIRDGINNRTDLIKEAKDRSCVSKSRVEKVLKAHDGPNYNQGHRWQQYKGDGAAKPYRLTRLRDAAKEYLKASQGE